MIRATRSLLAVALLTVGGAAIAATPASAAIKAPAWRIESHAAPTRFVPGLLTGQDMYVVTAINTGGAATDGSTITVTDELPAGFTFHSSGIGLLAPGISTDFQANPTPCVAAGTTITCQLDHTVVTGERISALLPVNAPASGPATVTNQVTVSGGGAAPASASEETPFDTDPVPFGIQHLQTSLTDADGSPATQAGSHPASFRFGFGIDTRIDPALPPSGIQPAENLRKLTATVPPGLVVNPAAAPRCTEAQLETGNLPRRLRRRPDRVHDHQVRLPYPGLHQPDLQHGRATGHRGLLRLQRHRHRLLLPHPRQRRRGQRLLAEGRHQRHHPVRRDQRVC